MRASIIVGLLVLVTPTTINAVEEPPKTPSLTLYPEVVIEETPEPSPVPVYTQITEEYDVMSEGVSSYYYNTTVYGVREGETDIITSTASVQGLGEEICVGNPLGDDSYATYPCVVLPESLSDQYKRGDKVMVEYNDNIYECVVIDFNQIEHGNHLNFVGEFTYTTGDTAWLVEEE